METFTVEAIQRPLKQASRSHLVLSETGDVLTHRLKPGLRRLGKTQRPILKELAEGPMIPADLARVLGRPHQKIHEAPRGAGTGGTCDQPRSSRAGHLRNPGSQKALRPEPRDLLHSQTGPRVHHGGPQGGGRSRPATGYTETAPVRSRHEAGLPRPREAVPGTPTTRTGTRRGSGSPRRRPYPVSRAHPSWPRHLT